MTGNLQYYLEHGECPGKERFSAEDWQRIHREIKSCAGTQAEYRVADCDPDRILRMLNGDWASQWSKPSGRCCPHCGTRI